MEKVCRTCGEPYTKVMKMSFRASICSSSFHYCKDCVWDAGKLMSMCEECSEYWKEEKCSIDCGCE